MVNGNKRKKKTALILEKIRKESSRENGQAIVEFAIALPLLLLILCGILDFGWIYTNQYKVEYAAYTGARYATINGPDMTSSQLTAGIQEVTASNIPDGQTQHVSVYVDSAGRTVRVTVNYPVRTITFVASTIYGRYYTATAEATASY